MLIAGKAMQLSILNYSINKKAHCYSPKKLVRQALKLFHQTKKHAVNYSKSYFFKHLELFQKQKTAVNHLKNDSVNHLKNAL